MLSSCLMRRETMIAVLCGSTLSSKHSMPFKQSNACVAQQTIAAIPVDSMEAKDTK